MRDNSYRLINKESEKQTPIIYGSVAIALYRYWGWRGLRIHRLFDLGADACEEIAGNNSISILEQLQNETGVSLQNHRGEDWEDLPYLNGSMEQPKMSKQMYLYMRQRQLSWIAPCIMASLLLALHRKEGFGAERIAKLARQVDEIRNEFGFDAKKIGKACLEETGVKLSRRFK